jgi:hypothetical protein
MKTNLEVDRRLFIASLGGAAAVAAMDHEARAESLEDYMSQQLEQAQSAQAQSGQAGAKTPEKFPTVAELRAQNQDRATRRGVGDVFVGRAGHTTTLETMPVNATLEDFFKYRFSTVNHVLQSANRAMKTGMTEEVILACLLHDVVQSLIKVDHGWWGAQMFEPYVSERVTFAIRYHQALRFYPDHEAGYEYPDLYKRLFGIDYEPPPHIQAAYKYARNHKMYMEARLVTVNDLYAFEPGVVVNFEQFRDVVGRHFKQPKEGLGNDNGPTAHMWRSMIIPDTPL